MIKRSYITLGNRQVHVRHSGAGDPVVLIHQSPTSGRTLDAQTEAYGRAGFQALAIDIPGLGRSDPIGLTQPEIEDQAFGLTQLLDTMGLHRVALYGSHTGALIACEFAARWPDRASVILIDGYPIYSEGERERRVATYFPSFTASWDGAHLAWLWSRYREQYLFWPWNIPGESTQAQCDVPDPVFLHEGVVDMLRVGNAYRMPYAAAFRCKSDELIRRSKVPTYFLAYPDDSLTPALALLQGLPACCKVESMPADRGEGIAQEIALIRRHAPGPGTARLATAARPSGITRGYVDTPSGQLAMRSSGADTGRPVIIVPPAPGSATMLADAIETIGRTRRVIALDAPGCGDSDAPAQMNVNAMGAMLGAAIDALGVDRFDLYAVNGGCAVAAEALASRRPRASGVVFEAPAGGYPADAAFLARYAPPIHPTVGGAHLLTLWHATRNRRLFRPWFEERLANRVADVAALDVELVNRDVLAYLESWRTYDTAWRAVLGYDGYAKLDAALRWASPPTGEFARGSFAGRTLEPLPAPVVPRCERVLELLAAR